MGKVIDLTGQRFGKLVAVRFVGTNKNSKRLYLCQCDCGNTIICDTSALRSGDTQSCGCLRTTRLIGQTFGEWTVISYAGNSKWLCQCSCGAKSIVSSTALKNGTSTSCGCKRRTNLVGQRFGRLLVVRKLEEKSKSNKTLYLCKCDCGNEKNILESSLVQGATRSCGCYKNEKTSKRNTISKTTHGKTHSALYCVWRGMKRRCYSKHSNSYPNYGGRGIAVCDEWRNDFQAFYDWAMANGYKEEFLSNGKNKWTIDRIDVNGNYEPSNCRWVTIETQMNNTTKSKFYKINGELLTVAQISKKYGIRSDTLRHRIKNGWDIKKAAETPILNENKKTV